MTQSQRSLTVDSRAKSPLAAPPSLRLEQRLASLLATSFDPVTDSPLPWSMPSPLPAKPELMQALSQVRLYLQPAGREFIQPRLALLRLSTKAPGTEGMSEHELGALLATQIGEYCRLLADFPPDIWASACDRLPRESPWFPTVADFERVMRPQLEERQRWARRLTAMLDAHNRPAAVPFVRESRPQRLGAIAASYLRHYGADDPRTIRAQREADQHQGATA